MCSSFYREIKSTVKTPVLEIVLNNSNNTFIWILQIKFLTMYFEIENNVYKNTNIYLHKVSCFYVLFSALVLSNQLLYLDWTRVRKKTCPSTSDIPTFITRVRQRVGRMQRCIRHQEGWCCHHQVWCGITHSGSQIHFFMEALLTFCWVALEK